LENRKGRDHLGDLGADRSILLKWFLITVGGGGLNFNWFHVQLNGGLLLTR